MLHGVGRVSPLGPPVAPLDPLVEAHAPPRTQGRSRRTRQRVSLRRRRPTASRTLPRASRSPRRAQRRDRGPFGRGAASARASQREERRDERDERASHRSHSVTRFQGSQDVFVSADHGAPNATRAGHAHARRALYIALSGKAGRRSLGAVPRRPLRARARTSRARAGTPGKRPPPAREATPVSRHRRPRTHRRRAATVWRIYGRGLGRRAPPWGRRRRRERDNRRGARRDAPPTPVVENLRSHRGLVGYGVYALERMPRPPAAALLERIVQHLATSAESGPAGITWRSRPAWLPKGCGDLLTAGATLASRTGFQEWSGCSGGSWRAGVARKEAARLLDGAVGWLLAQELPKRSVSCFPSYVLEGQEPAPARAAWCYGDPGVAAALLVAARASGEVSWKRAAVRIASQAAMREESTSHVADAGLCHGAAGLAQVFQRIYVETEDPRFSRAARTWLPGGRWRCGRARARGLSLAAGGEAAERAAGAGAGRVVPDMRTCGIAMALASLRRIRRGGVGRVGPGHAVVGGTAKMVVVLAARVSASRSARATAPLPAPPCSRCPQR